MKSTYKWGAVAFGISLVSTIVYGQARTPFTRPAYITTSGNITTSANVSASTLSVGTTSTSTRAHFLTEATAYTPTDFTTSHAVFGRNAVSGAGSGGVWLSYHTTDNEGIVGSLSPVVAWRPLSFASSEWKFRQNGATLIANITSTGAFNSVAASGNQAFTCTNTGCRLSLGNTGRYLVDDGTNLEFIAPVQATTFEATTASGSSLTGGGASGPLLLTSNTPDSHTSTTVPAFLLKPSTALSSGDAVFQVQSSAGADEFRIRGGAGSGGSAQAIIGGGVGRFSGQTLTNFTGELTLDTWRTAASNVTGVSIGSFNALTGDQTKVLSIRNGSNFATEIAHFSKDGLLRVNQANAAKPTCNADNRGRVFYLDGAASVADTYEICMKNASDVYAWKTIVTP